MGHDSGRQIVEILKSNPDKVSRDHKWLSDIPIGFLSEEADRVGCDSSYRTPPSTPRSRSNISIKSLPTVLDI